MSRRSRKHRKRFACGHRGYGQFCHRCAEVEAKQAAKRMRRWEAKQTRQANKLQDPVDLSRLPAFAVRKARQIMAALNQGVGYWMFGGKRLQANREVIRIPVSHRYRLLCRSSEAGLEPLKVLSHEAYNPLVRRKNRI